MKIDSIEIIDFRGIEKRKFSFNKNFNVLIGENGSGKTSVLEALAVAINSYLYVSQDNKNIRPIRKEDVRVFNFGPSLEEKINTEIIIHGELDGIQLEWTVKKPNRSWGFMQGDDKKLKDMARQHKNELSIDGGRNLLLPAFNYLGSGRLWLDPYNPTKKVNTLPKGSRYEGYTDALRGTSSLKRFTQWYKTITLSALQGNTDSKWREKVIERAISNCLEGWDSVYFDVEEDALMALKKSDAGVRKLPVSFLSDGQRNIIGIIADIAYRCILLNPYLEYRAAEETPGIVLIDELDLHLHPKWQKKIVGNLKTTFPKIQFITTTHSPFIIQSLKNKELFDMDGKELDTDYFRKSIDEITKEEMGVDILRSEKFNNMMAIAEEYFKLIKQTKSDDLFKIKELKNKLKEYEIEFSEDPAYVALLKSELPK